MKYRIKEHCGVFTIEIYAWKYKRFPYNKKKIWTWEKCNVWGGVHNNHPVMQPPCKTFKNIEKAKEQAKEWELNRTTKPIYHEI